MTEENFQSQTAVPQTGVPNVANPQVGPSSYAAQTRGEVPMPGQNQGSDNFRIDQIMLLKQSDSGMIELPGLSLEIQTNGIAIKKASGPLVTVMPWSLIVSTEVEDEEKFMPNDPDSVKISLATDSRVHYFRKRGVKAEELSAQLNSAIGKFRPTAGVQSKAFLNLSDILPWVGLALAVVVSIILYILHLAGAIKIA